MVFGVSTIDDAGEVSFFVVPMTTLLSDEFKLRKSYQRLFSTPFCAQAISAGSRHWPTDVTTKNHSARGYKNLLMNSEF